MHAHDQMPIEACIFVCCIYNDIKGKHTITLRNFCHSASVHDKNLMMSLTVSQQFPNLHLESTTTNRADGNTAPISTTTGALIGIILAVVLFTAINACALYAICIYLRQKSLKETQVRGDLQQTVSHF